MYVDSIRGYFRSLPSERFPLISSMADTITGIPDSDERFELGLDLLIQGLARYNQQERRSERRGGTPAR